MIAFAFALLGCAHGRALEGISCSFPSSEFGWQVDRVEPPWAVLVDEREESILVHQDCFEQLREGMVLVQGRIDLKAEKLWSDRIRETLSRLTRKAQY